MLQGVVVADVGVSVAAVVVYVVVVADDDGGTW
jgi:hypothetical protein